ncbi:MAG: hypothetical protein Hals2KO_30250 [Halioglobus sp.]
MITFVVIVYDMPQQAQNTITSLLPSYQVDVSAADYDVIIVENRSENLMSPEFLRTMPDGFRYFLRDESEPTPIHAINFGIEKARGKHVCVMIDGARVLSPGIVKYMLLAHQISDRTVVTVPGYHIGFELQQDAVRHGYGEERERELMRSISWPEDGYRLFEIACFSGSSAPGLYLPHSESNCISMARTIWDALGGYDARFDMRGGGLVNLDMYKRACEYPGVTQIILHGEGTFHQFHGGVTTGGGDISDRENFINAIKAQYNEIRGEGYTSPETTPVYFGELSNYVQKFVYTSSVRKLERLGIDVDMAYQQAHQ